MITGIISIFQSNSSETQINEIEDFSTDVFSFNVSSLSSKDFIAVIHIEGVIEDKNETYDQAWLLDQDMPKLVFR